MLWYRHRLNETGEEKKERKGEALGAILWLEGGRSSSVIFKNRDPLCEVACLLVFVLRKVYKHKHFDIGWEGVQIWKALGTGRIPAGQARHGGWGQLGYHSEFQTSLGSVMRPCHKWEQRRERGRGGVGKTTNQIKKDLCWEINFLETVFLSLRAQVYIEANTNVI